MWDESVPGCARLVENDMWGGSSPNWMLKHTSKPSRGPPRLFFGYGIGGPVYDLVVGNDVDVDEEIDGLSNQGARGFIVHPARDRANAP